MKFGTDRGRPRRDGADAEDRTPTPRTSGPHVGYRSDPERGAARAPGGRVQGDPDRGAGDPQRGRLRRRAEYLRTSSSISSTTPSRAWMTAETGCSTLLGQPRCPALLRPADLLRAVGRHLPEPPQRGRVDDRERRSRTTASCRRSRRTRESAEEGGGRDDQPPRAASRDARGCRAGHPASRSSTSTPTSSCSRSDCGFGRQGVPRPIAMYKAAALAQGANIVRAEPGRHDRGQGRGSRAAGRRDGAGGGAGRLTAGDQRLR